MSHETILTYRAGEFVEEPRPAWLREIYRSASGSRDWNACVRVVLSVVTAQVIIGDEYWPHGELRAYRTPEGGQYVEMSAGDGVFAEVWVPHPADWLTFNARYVEPFLRTRAALYQADGINRLGNALIAFARHGEGKHVDRDTGESSIDHHADRLRSKGWQASSGFLASSGA